MQGHGGQPAQAWHLLAAAGSTSGAGGAEASSFAPYQQNDEGLFPVHVAAMTNQRDAVDILLRRCPGCMVLRDTLGRTFLHVAVENKAFSVVKYACARSKFASIMNIQDKNGNTPLHLAVDVQSVVITCALLGNLDVRLDLWNGKGQTALDLARGRIRAGFLFTGNPAKMIYSALESVGARHGIYCIPQPKPKVNGADKKEVSDEFDKVTSLSQILFVVSVSIMMMTPLPRLESTVPSAVPTPAQRCLPGGGALTYSWLPTRWLSSAPRWPWLVSCSPAQLWFHCPSARNSCNVYVLLLIFNH